MTATDHSPGGHHYTDEEMHNEDVAYEHGDVNVRQVLGFAAAIVAIVAIAAVLMYGLFVTLEKQAEARDPQVSPRASTNRTPRGPQLVTNEPKNLRQFHDEEQGTLETYGWINQSQGVAHVPIDMAKKLVLEHGLPVRPDAPDDKSLGTNAPAYGESSGGRAIPVEHAVPPSPSGTAPEPPPADKQNQAPAGQEIKK